nr:HD domain-containing protein [Desulfobulbaceae bacterium]
MEAFHVIAISVGVAFLAAAICQSRNARKMIPKSVRDKWLVIDYFMRFFLLGYVLYLFAKILDIRMPAEYLVSIVFLGGAVYVFIVIKVSQQVIRQISESQQKVSQANKELEEAYESTVEGWGRALELRDYETKGHTNRVCALTLELAKAYNLTDKQRWFMKIGVLLHDIGKMAVPDSILLNDGLLTPEERELMERHPLYAKELLEGISFLQPALAIPYCHHERWDGTGYPQGLKGEEIPLWARIFAVADVWDALISERRYHLAWDAKKVCEHIVKGSGSHFDPEVVTRFLELDLCEVHGEVLAGEELPPRPEP